MKYIHIIENENSIDVTYFDGTELKQSKFGTGRKYDSFPIAAHAALMRALKITKQNAKTEQPEPEYLNCEVICVDDGGYPWCWKEGYKYRFENGSLRFPDGEKVGKFTSLEQANELTGARFMLYRGEA